MWTQLFTPTQPCFLHFRGHQTDIHVYFRGEIRISGVWRTSWSNSRHFGACSVVAGYPDQSFGSHALAIVYIVCFKEVWCRQIFLRVHFDKCICLSFFIRTCCMHQVPEKFLVPQILQTVFTDHPLPYLRLWNVQIQSVKETRNKYNFMLFSLFGLTYVPQCKLLFSSRNSEVLYFVYCTPFFKLL